MQNDSQSFIEFLLSCSLDKAGTVLSKLGRNISIEIMAARSDQIANTFLESENDSSSSKGSDITLPSPPKNKQKRKK
jgi:hypothetical protein